MEGWNIGIMGLNEKFKLQNSKWKRFLLSLHFLFRTLQVAFCNTPHLTCCILGFLCLLKNDPVALVVVDNAGLQMHTNKKGEERRAATG